MFLECLSKNLENSTLLIWMFIIPNTCDVGYCWWLCPRIIQSWSMSNTSLFTVARKHCSVYLYMPSEVSRTMLGIGCHLSDSVVAMKALGMIIQFWPGSRRACRLGFGCSLAAAQACRVLTFFGQSYALLMRFHHRRCDELRACGGRARKGFLRLL